MADITDFEAARQRLEALKQPQVASTLYKEGPLAALVECVSDLVRVNMQLTANLAAVEQATAANAAKTATLAEQMKILTRAQMGAFADVLSRLPPAAAPRVIP